MAENDDFIVAESIAVKLLTPTHHLISEHSLSHADTSADSATVTILDIKFKLKGKTSFILLSYYSLKE